MNELNASLFITDYSIYWRLSSRFDQLLILITVQNSNANIIKAIVPYVPAVMKAVPTFKNQAR